MAVAGSRHDPSCHTGSIVLQTPILHRPSPLSLECFEPRISLAVRLPQLHASKGIHVLITLWAVVRVFLPQPLVPFRPHLLHAILLPILFAGLHCRHFWNRKLMFRNIELRIPPPSIHVFIAPVSTFLSKMPAHLHIVSGLRVRDSVQIL